MSLLDTELLYDICLFKANWGLQIPKDIKIIKIIREVDDIVVYTTYLDGRERSLIFQYQIVSTKTW
jgi:hypothetical protein